MKTPRKSSALMAVVVLALGVTGLGLSPANADSYSHTTVQRHGYERSTYRHDSHGYWDNHSSYRHYTYYDHHRGYWGSRDDGVRIFFILD